MGRQPKGGSNDEQHPEQDQLNGQMDLVPGQLEAVPLDRGLFPFALRSNYASSIPFDRQTDLLGIIDLRWVL